MPKAQPDDAFNVHVMGVPLERLGPLTAMLAREGFGQVHNELVTTVRSFARNAPAKDGISNIEFLRAWVADHPTFKAIDAQHYFREAGRPPVYPTIRALIDDGTLKKLGPGDYSRADVKQLAAPKKKAKAMKKAVPHKFEINAEAALLSIARRNHGRFTSELAKKHFTVLGRKPTGVGPSINKLLRDKLIRRTDTGSYELTAKGQGGKLKAPKPNGAAPPTPEPVAVAIEV